MTEHKIPIPSRIYNASGGNVCGTDDVIDDVKGKKQSQINTEVDNAIQNEIERATEAENNRYTKNEVYKKEETYNKNELNNLITTPNQEYVTVVATDQTTAATDVLPATGSADTIYRVGNWDGSQYDESLYTEYAWNGSAYVSLTVKSQVGEVYDISLNHAGATYADLAAALGTNGTNIPVSLRKGGMSIKYVQSSDNKYMQYRLKSNTFNVDVSNWVGGFCGFQEIEVSGLASCGGTIRDSDHIWFQNSDYYGALIDVSDLKGEYVSIIPNKDNGSTFSFVADDKSWGNSVNFANGYSATLKITESTIVQIPNNAKYLYVYLQSPDVDFRPQRIVICNKETGEINNKVVGKILNVINTYLTSCGAFIFRPTNTWNNQQMGFYEGALIDISEYTGKYCNIVTSGYNLVYTFLKSGVVLNSTPEYAQGYTDTIISDSENTSVLIPEDAVYLYILYISDGSTKRPQHIIIYDKGIEEKIFNLNRDNKELFGTVLQEYDVNKLTSCGGTIRNDNNTWFENLQYVGSILPISQYRGKYVHIIPHDYSKLVTYTFLKEGPSWNNSPVYATGYSSTINETEVMVQIPNDAVYLYVYLQSLDIDYRPSEITFYEDDNTGKIKELESSISELYRDNIEIEEKFNDSISLIKKLQPISPLKVATWNIGHFSFGYSPYSTITAEDYAEKLAQYKDVVYSQIDANILGINEYSRVFGDNKLAKDVLFNDYAIQFEGEQNNYSCNAVYGDIFLENIVKHNFECLQNETITHTSLILATDYYYITADTYIRGRKIKLFVTHLAFDNNRPSVLQEKQIAELISVAANEPRVLMLGDWNVYEQADFDAFVQNGYTLANDGTIYTYPSTSPNRALDNIIVRGLNITNIGVVQSTLSDHIPLYATINI